MESADEADINQTETEQVSQAANENIVSRISISFLFRSIKPV
jgi:hypothetical protein